MKEFNIKKVISFDFPKIKISLQSPGKEIISPGQLLTHYSPKSNLRLNVLEPSKEEVYLAFGSKEASIEGFSLSENKILTEAARNLYNYLRLADEMILKDPNSNKKSIAVIIDSLALNKELLSIFSTAAYSLLNLLRAVR